MENIEPLDVFQLRDAQPEEFEKRTFVINDESQAAWAMRKLAVAQRRIDQVRRQAQDEMDRITRWVEYATKSDQATVDYFSECLSSYIKRLRLEDGRKSLSLPDGNVKSREVPEKLKVDDLDAFLKWVDESPELAKKWTRTKREPDVSAIKSEVVYSNGLVVDNATGETIAGLSHVEGSISVTVEVSE
jgi:phage host-nuclease inhibitor protein Gam